MPKEQQRRDTQNGVHIVVATPGRLLNLMDEGVFNLDRVTYLVLDEVCASSGVYACLLSLAPRPRCVCEG